MFTKSSELYDFIYSTKDYRSESNTLAKILLSHYPGCSTVLDVGCGTAEHHRFLAEKFRLEGIDLNEEFIGIARSKNPSGKYFVANMSHFDLGNTYDAVVCLFSSIGYVGTVENLISTLSCFKKHLGERGVLIIEPWITPAMWIPDKIHMQTYDSDDLKICRMAHTSTKNQKSVLDFEYLIGKPDGIQKFHEKHELGLFDHDTMVKAFEHSDLDCDFMATGLTGRGLYIGTHKKSN